MRIFQSGDLGGGNSVQKTDKASDRGPGSFALTVCVADNPLAPSGGLLMLELYCLTNTDQTILNGAWKPPGVH